jgi:hypothetical protein
MTALFSLLVSFSSLVSAAETGDAWKAMHEGSIKLCDAHYALFEKKTQGASKISKQDRNVILMICTARQANKQNVCMTKFKEGALELTKKGITGDDLKEKLKQFEPALATCVKEVRETIPDDVTVLGLLAKRGDAAALEATITSWMKDGTAFIPKNSGTEEKTSN